MRGTFGCAVWPGRWRASCPARVPIDAAAPPDRRSCRADLGLFRRLAPLHQPRIGRSEAVRGLREGLAGIGFADAAFRTGRCRRLLGPEARRERGGLDGDLRRMLPPAEARAAA